MKELINQIKNLPGVKTVGEVSTSEINALIVTFEPEEKNKVHNLKILPEYYRDVALGIKNFEIRKDDRDYKVGDALMLHEHDGSTYTGSGCTKQIKYILRDCEKYGLKKGYVILSF